VEDPAHLDEARRDRWLRWTDRWIPKHLLADPSVALRARVIVALAVIPTMVSLVVQALRLSLGSQHWIAIASWAVCTALFAAMPFVLRMTGRLEIAGCFPSIAVSLGALGVAVFEGGLASPNTLVILCAPVLTTFLSGRVAGLWVSGGVIFALALVSAAHAFGGLGAVSTLHPDTLLVMRSLLYCIMTLGLLLVVYLYDHERAHTQLALEHKAKELERARDEALEAVRAKSAFLANMSHEIRTPLTAVIGMTQLMLSTGKSADDQRDLEIVQKSGQALLSVINDVLDYSKIEAKQVRIESEPFHLRGCIEDVIEMVRHAANAKRLQVLFNDVECPEHVFGDALRVQQVLTNLLSNAIKFTEHGFVRVHARRLDDQMIELAVEDTGIGIPKDGQAHLFQPFAQADASTTRKYGGSGLGLAISRRLVELMGGTLGLNSTKGGGSTFAFTLNARDATLGVPSVSGMHPISGSILRRAAGAPLRILLAEDNLVNARIFVAMLRKFGETPTVVDDGEQALSTLRSERYDLVFLDVQMPKLDGLEVARRLQRDAAPGELPYLVAFTASVLSDQRETYTAAGFDDVLPKPVVLQDVEAVLARAAEALRRKPRRSAG